MNAILKSKFEEIEALSDGEQRMLSELVDDFLDATKANPEIDHLLQVAEQRDGATPADDVFADARSKAIDLR